MTKTQLSTLVPMSSEDLKLRRYKNTRHENLIQLWFVDGLGEAFLLVTSEIHKFGLDEKWPAYMRHNAGIKAVNQWRRELT
jgi:hypothetical protein